ncbi:hypothetical protein [Mucilaginibacter panaciglaebae]
MKIDKAKRICKLYSTGEYTIATCCKAEGIEYNTFQGWAQPNLSEEDIKNEGYRRGFVHEVHVLYKKALINNEINFKALLRDAAREGLLDRARGTVHTETHLKVKYDSNGNAISTVIRKIEKYLPPDTNILIFLANCLRIFEYHDDRLNCVIDL